MSQKASKTNLQPYPSVPGLNPFQNTSHQLSQDQTADNETSNVSQEKKDHLVSGKKGKPRRQSREARSRFYKNAAYRKKIVQSYPNIKMTDSVAVLEIDECAKCHINVGCMAFLPCGHGKYCMKCVSHLHQESVKSMIPGRCLSKKCLSFVKSWFVLHRIDS